MPRRSRQPSESGIHHVMLRGVNRDVIFIENEDYQRFLNGLAAAKGLSGCVVLAYCLMSNHVHLVIRTGAEPIGNVIKRVAVRYARYFNDKYGRVGHVFQDRFRSQPIETDTYFVTLVRYVWNNPVEAGLTSRADDYRWSSRRLLGVPDSLIDESELRRLMLHEPEELITMSTLTEVAQASGGQPPRYRDENVSGFLFLACGAAGPRTFALLDASAKCRAIHELRARSVSYAQIARITGLGKSAVYRMHVVAPA